MTFRTNTQDLNQIGALVPIGLLADSYWFSPEGWARCRGTYGTNLERLRLLRHAKHLAASSQNLPSPPNASFKALASPSTKSFEMLHADFFNSHGHSLELIGAGTDIFL